MSETSYIIRPRAGGKTTEMLAYAAANPGGTIIVGAERMAALTRAKLKREDITATVVVAGREQMMTLRGRRSLGPIMLDDLDIILPMLLGLDRMPDVVTATGLMVPRP